MAKKKTILDLQQMKANGEQAAWMVIYDSCLASFAEEVGMDMILVGDSMGMIIYGYDGTVPVTMDMSIAHCQGVRRGAPNTYLIGDMPFGSYHASCEDAVNNAVRFIKEGGVDAIKLEGGVAIADKIRAIANAGIVVFGHIGLTPQSSAAMGGFKVQGKNTATAKATPTAAHRTNHTRGRRTFARLPSLCWFHLLLLAIAAPCRAAKGRKSKIFFGHSKITHKPLLQACSQVVAAVHRDDCHIASYWIAVLCMASVLRNEYPAALLRDLCKSLARYMLHTETCIIEECPISDGASSR